MDTIDKAFEEVGRENFVPVNFKRAAILDEPVPIGYGQTNSQPSTVKMMFEWLDPRPGQKILDVGAGSGWTSTLLSRIVGSKGYVYAVERIPELVEFGENNARKAGAKNVAFTQAGEAYGLSEHAPYDRILVSASADKVPEELIDQLEVGGKLVIPVYNDILEITKKNGDSEVKTHPGFVFVPLI
jgi:protein-L-isoaspartate(D-aspartate) O-methyltransferase